MQPGIPDDHLTMVVVVRWYHECIIFFVKFVCEKMHKLASQIQTEAKSSRSSAPTVVHSEEKYTLPHQSLSAPCKNCERTRAAQRGMQIGQTSCLQFFSGWWENQRQQMTAREATRKRDSSQLQISFQNQEQFRIVQKNFRYCDGIQNRYHRSSLQPQITNFQIEVT